MKKQEVKNLMTKFIHKQREERYAFGWKQHMDLLAFKESQMKERQQFIAQLQGGDQC